MGHHRFHSQGVIDETLTLNVPGEKLVGLFPGGYFGCHANPSFLILIIYPITFSSILAIIFRQVKAKDPLVLLDTPAGVPAVIIALFTFLDYNKKE